MAAHLLNDAEAKQRFVREAKAAAAITHPNICHVYEIAEEDGKTFLAMTCLEGESLEDRITKGPLPLKDALDIGQQIAEGLEAAHDKGIVHRDIKPANVMVDAKGHATILDFGLARLTEASKLTRQDQTIGTAAYMSPEQIQGGDVDHRTDVWALGCVLYEMVAGVRPFKGQYDQALAYEIVNQEPEPLTGVRSGVPMELELLVAKFLAKQPQERYGHTDEIARDLTVISRKIESGRSTILAAARMGGADATTAREANPPDAPPPGAVVMNRGVRRALYALIAALALSTAAFGVAYFRSVSREPEPIPLRRFSLAQETVGSAVISPDGLHIAFTVLTRDGDHSVWLRSLADETARELPGSGFAYPFNVAWSPDSRSIVFGADGQLKRLSIDGGDPTTLCALPRTDSFPFAGAAVSGDGEKIVFSSGVRLWEIPARGGQPRQIFNPGDQPAYWAPQFLPHGDGSRYLIYTTQIDTVQRRTELYDFETGERRPIAPGQGGVYAPPGYLLHGAAEVGGRGLFAMPFSLATLAPTGDSFPLADSASNSSWPSVSRDETLAYSDGAADGFAQIVVRDRSGEVIRSIGNPTNQPSWLAVSPDGRRALAAIVGGLWAYDLDRDVRVRMPSATASMWNASWLPSGREFIVSTERGALIYSVNGEGEPADLGFRANQPSFSTDGRYIVYVATNPEGDETGIWRREIGAGGSFSEAVSWLLTPNDERQPQISPDSKYLAYRSDESGRNEIYVRKFPSGQEKVLVSTNGGTRPRWSRDGDELFYVEDSSLMAVPWTAGETFAVGTPERLFESPELESIAGVGYDVFPDGQRFLMVRIIASGDVIRIVQNWSAAFDH